MTKASIIFLSYQHEQFIAEALVSALEQDYPDVEVIVADDGSTDRTKAIIQEIIRTHPRGHRATVLPDAPNMGIVANWDRSVAVATGDVLIAMASDDIATPNRVSKAVYIFDSDPEVMAVFSQVSLIDSEGFSWIYSKKIGHAMPSSSVREMWPESSSGKVHRCLAPVGVTGQHWRKSFRHCRRPSPRISPTSTVRCCAARSPMFPIT